MVSVHGGPRWTRGAGNRLAAAALGPPARRPLARDRARAGRALRRARHVDERFGLPSGGPAAGAAHREPASPPADGAALGPDRHGAFTLAPPCPGGRRRSPRQERLLLVRPLARVERAAGGVAGNSSPGRGGGRAARRVGGLGSRGARRVPRQRAAPHGDRGTRCERPARAAAPAAARVAAGRGADARVYAARRSRRARSELARRRVPRRHRPAPRPADGARVRGRGRGRRHGDAARGGGRALMPLSRHGDWRIGHRLLLLARPFWPHLALLFLLTLLAAPLQLLVPLPLKIAVDSVLGSHPLRGVLARLVPAALAHSKSTLLLAAAGMMIAIALLTQLHALGTWWLQSWVGERLVFDFRARLFAQAQRLSLAYHDSRGVSDSTYRIQYDAVSPQNLAITGTIPLATSALAVVGMIIVLARLDLRLALVAVAVCPVLFVLSHTFGGQVRRRSREVKRLDSSTMSMVHEALAAARVVKSFGREEHEALDHRSEEHTPALQAP